MESLYLLIPLGIGAVVLILAVLGWSIYSGQYEDLEGPAHSILFDDDTTNPSNSKK